MATNNFYINAQDGWVQIATNPAFIRVTAAPHHSYLIADGASPPPLNSTNATGTVTLSSTGPLDTETVTVGGQVYTFKTSPVAATDVAINVSINVTATNLATKIAANSASTTASAVGPIVTVSARATGTAGNAITLAKAATNVAVSGATLTGAVDILYGVLVKGKFCVNVPITGNVYARTLDSTPDRALRLDVFTVPTTP